MKKTFKYRLFPTKAQRTKLNDTMELCRWVYNETLATRKDAWENEQKTLSRYDTIKMLPDWKKDKPELQSVYSQTLQNVCTRVDLAFQAFFRRVKAGEKPGYPRFRGYGRYNSFTYPQNNGAFRFLENDRLSLSKIGEVKIKIHRPVEGKIKTLTVRRDAVGNWYACFACEIEPESLPVAPRVVGIDVGLSHFATLSDGEQIENPRFFRRDEKALAKAQQRLSKCEPRTPEYRKARRVIQHIHQRIANRRRDFAHKLSRRLVNEYQIISFEKLDIQDMQDGNFRGMNKSISDAAWRQFREYTSYKAAWADRLCVEVDPRNTTKMCSACGEIVPKTLSERVHRCPHCGLEMDRDHNAALNILARGLASVGSIPRSPAL